MHSDLNRLAYRETVRGSGFGDGKVIRQRAGRANYAHVCVEVRALDRGKGVIFGWNAGATIPARFAGSVAQGIQDVVDAGILEGLEVTDVRASIESGSYHDEDSNAEAFREAAQRAMTEALRQAGPIILEALALVSIAVPVELTSTVERIVSVHRGRIKSDVTSPPVVAILPASHRQVLIGEVLKASDGRASITAESAGFQPRPEPPDTFDPWAAVT